MDDASLLQRVNIWIYATKFKLQIWVIPAIRHSVLFMLPWGLNTCMLRRLRRAGSAGDLKVRRINKWTTRVCVSEIDRHREMPRHSEVYILPDVDAGSGGSFYLVDLF